MPLSRQDVLALEVVVAIANGRTSRAPDLVRRLGLKPRSLEQLLQRLARKGILAGQRGSGGGYRLARGADQISASEVVRAARSRLSRKPKFVRGSSGVKRLVKELDRRTFAWLGEMTIASLASPR
jgi:Rrf2 family transcriptional regulator, iron-sulfur cluster assembly transcription factor